MTEKDREVERLLRELDIREYDLKALKEENERLEEYCATDTGRQQELERKVRNLEAVIEDNRNLIAELRRNLEDKDRELRQVRAGAGIADLEQERQRLLDDFHKKSRENDALRTNAATLNAELSGVVAERDDLVQKMRAIEEGGRTRRAEREDVTDHPDYRARVREIESRDGEIATLAREIEALREQNASRTEEAARLVSEASASREKARALELRVAEIEAAPVVDVVTAPVQVPKPGEDQLKALESVGAGLDALLDGLAVFQSELRQTADVLAALASSTDGIPGQVMEALHGATPDESAKAVRDLLRVVGEDSARVRAAWSEAERLWNPHS
jgi:DNA repair exonuclease SbcCD ATPase subunit